MAEYKILEVFSAEADFASDCKWNYSVNITGHAELVRTKPKLSVEVLIHLVTLLEVARHSSYNANNDFLYSNEALGFG